MGLRPKPRHLREYVIMKKRSFNDKVIAGHKTKTSKERSMNQIKYIGMDVHMTMTVIAVLNSTGKQIIEAIIETKERLGEKD